MAFSAIARLSSSARVDPLGHPAAQVVVVELQAGPAQLLGPVHGGVRLAHEAGRRGAGVGEGDAGTRWSPTARRWGAPWASDSMTSVTRRPTAMAWSSFSTPSKRTTNSSPPRRATRSLGRRTVRMRSAIWQSRSSPTSWPRVSLTSLKLVDVEEEQGDVGAVPARPGQGLLEVVEEQGPVGQPGEGVVQGPVGPRRLDPAAVGHVPGHAAQLPELAVVVPLGPQGHLDVDRRRPPAPRIVSSPFQVALGLDLGEDLALEAAQGLGGEQGLDAWARRPRRCRRGPRPPR